MCSRFFTSTCLELTVQLKDVVWGALQAGILWELLKYAFIWYIAAIGDFSKVYGSISAVPVLLIWMHVSALILIWGGEFSADYKQIQSPAKVELKRLAQFGRPKPKQLPCRLPGRWPRRSRASSSYIQLCNSDKQALTESLGFAQQTASQILRAISPGE